MSRRKVCDNSIKVAVGTIVLPPDVAGWLAEEKNVSGVVRDALVWHYRGRKGDLEDKLKKRDMILDIGLSVSADDDWV